MKKQLIGLGVAALMFSGVGSASATLVDNGNGVIFDDVANIYWMQDLSYFTNMTYDEQITGISVMNQEPFEGGKYWNPDTWENWHMAPIEDVENIWSYSTQVLAQNFTNTSTDYWAGRVNTSFGIGYHYRSWFSANSGENLYASYQDISPRDYLGAWVVADAVAPVPEPATMLLFGTGLVGLLVPRLRKKKK